MIFYLQSVSRAVINEESNPKMPSGKAYYLLVEGYGLQDVMGRPGVDGKECKSNHIIEMQVCILCVVIPHT